MLTGDAGKILLRSRAQNTKNKGDVVIGSMPPCGTGAKITKSRSINQHLPLLAQYFCQR